MLLAEVQRWFRRRDEVVRIGMDREVHGGLRCYWALVRVGERWYAVWADSPKRLADNLLARTKPELLSWHNGAKVYGDRDEAERLFVLYAETLWPEEDAVIDCR
jgi:hypothetical protein